MTQLETYSRERAIQNVFTARNFIELQTVTLDHATACMPARAELCNSLGILHGGALYTLADTAAGHAVFSDGRQYVTLDSSMQYISNIRRGVATAQADVIHRGRSTVTAQVRITAEDGKLLATGGFRFYCVADQKPADCQ